MQLPLHLDPSRGPAARRLALFIACGPEVPRHHAPMTSAVALGFHPESYREPVVSANRMAA